jgi:5'-nucleotidase
LKILITNDDGVWARGLSVLAERIAREPENEVYVVAPDRERSATGHALTLHKPIRVQKVEMEGKMRGVWWTTGTPSDCVKFAYGHIVPAPIDLVVSGINSGPNLGSEILYSGTVSAAMEGAFLDIPSIAVSTGSDGHRHYDVAADFVVRLIKLLPESGLGKRLLLNINVPNLPAEKLQGARVTRLGVRAYTDHFEKRVDPRGKSYYWLAGEAIEEGEEEGTDAWCMSHNMISVTPITFNMTDLSMIDKLQNLEGFGRLLERGGSAPVKDGSKQVSEGSKQVSDGSKQVSDGSKQVSDGSKQVSDGSKQVSDGSKQVSDGSKQVSDGSKQVSDGSKQLSDGSTQVSGTGNIN